MFWHQNLKAKKEATSVVSMIRSWIIHTIVARMNKPVEITEFFEVGYQNHAE